MGGGDSLETGQPSSRGVEQCWTWMGKGVGGLENETIFMDVICVLSLT